MTGAVHRASLLVQMLFYYVRFDILQQAGKWTQFHTRRKAKFQNLTKKSSVGDDYFSDMGSSVVAEEGQSAALGRCNESVKDNCTSHSKGSVKKSFFKTKMKRRFRRNKVTPSDSHGNGNREFRVEGRKRNNSHTIGMFGSRSKKASNIKSDFDKPYGNNTGV